MTLTKKVGDEGTGTLRSLLAIVDQCLVSGTNFLSAVIVGRAAGAHELGGFSLAVAVAVTVVVLQESLVIAPYTVFLPQLRETAKRRYAGAILQQWGVMSALAAGLMLLVAFSGKLAGMPQEMWQSILVLAVVCPGWLLRDFFRRTAFADLRVVEPVAMDATVAVLQLCGLGLLAWNNVLSMTSAVLIVGCVQGLCGAAWWIVWGPHREHDPRANRVLWRKNWRFGRWYSASRMVSIGQTYALHWLLAWFAGPATTGLFASCATLIALSNPVLMGVGNLLAARASRQYSTHGIDGLQIVLWRYGKWVVLFSAAFAVVIVLLREPLIRQLFGEPFLESAFIIPWLAAALVASSIGMAADNGLRALNRPSSNLVASSIGLTTTIVVAVPLMSQSPLLAAGWGVLAGSVATSAYRCWAFSLWSRDSVPCAAPN